MTTEERGEEKSLEEMWAEVENDAGNFNAWRSLLTHVEQNVLSIGIQSARDAFVSFFMYHPYCHWYWKKLADLERENLQEGEELAMEKCQEIFEKGLDAIPLSVDLWLQYIDFTKSKLKDRDDEVEELRALYKRAVDAAGLEFLSDTLWDSWISWETEQQQLVNVTAIYDKLISTPTQLYPHHFKKFQDLLENCSFHEVLGEEEIEEWKQLYEQRKGRGATDEDEPTFIKREAMQRRKNVYKKNETAWDIRYTSEERVVAIVRPFHERRPGLKASSEISVRQNRSAPSRKGYKMLFEQTKAALVAAEAALKTSEAALKTSEANLAATRRHLEMALFTLNRQIIPPPPAVYTGGQYPPVPAGVHPQAYGQHPPPPTAYAPQPTANNYFRGASPPPLAHGQQRPPPRDYRAPPPRDYRATPQSYSRQ